MLTADAVFVIEWRGLLVTNSGKLDDGEAQAMGARLLVTLDKADALEPGSPVRTITIDLAVRCLTGFRLQLESGQLLTVGLLSQRPLAAGAGAMVRSAFASKLGEG